ncbi:MAG: efflux RND transporter permease subunit [Steroidobacteraceae bacterium]
MKLLEFPIRRYQFTLVAFLCLTALGWFAFASIPREEDPHIKFPAVFVTGIYPGADPVDLERLFAKPIEDKLAELEHVKKIETTVTDGVALIAIEFEASEDADKKFDEVTREVNALRGQLPPEIQKIELRKISPALVNILQLALVSKDAPYRELQDYARDLKDALKTVDGIRTSESWAYPERELRVQIDLKRMAEMRITPGNVIQALQSENANIPAGFIDLGTRSFSLQASGSYENVDQVRDTIVASSGGGVVRVRDIATVDWASRPLSYVGRYNGERAVFVTANQKDNYNIIEVQKRVDVELDKFASALPKRIALERGFSQSTNVEARLNRLYMDFGIAIMLVLVTLLPLGLRAAGIVMMSIPLSLAIGLTVLYFLDYSLNQITIAGFVLSLGLLVDDSIVVVENIARHLRTGISRNEAALAGTKQIFEAIVGCTATLVFAFLPLAVLPGSPGKFIRVLPVTIMATILGSLFVALLFIPFLASRLLKPETDAHGNKVLQKVMAGIHRYYRPALHYCLARPKQTVFAALGGSLALILLLFSVLGGSLFPKADTPQFLVTVSTPNGSSLAETDRALRFVESRLKTHAEVRSYFANLGHGNPQIYYNHIVRNDSANFAEVFVQLTGYTTRETPRFLDRLRGELERYPGAKIYVTEFVQGSPVSSPVAVRIVGRDLEAIADLAGKVESVVKGTPGTRDVSNPLRVARTNLRLMPDSTKASLLGVPTVEFDRAVRLSVSGIPAGTFKNDDGEQYNIVVRTPVGDRADFSVLDEIRLPTVTGATLPLSQLATLQFEKAPNRIQRFNRQRSVTIDAHVVSGFNTRAVTEAVVKRLDAMSWPRGYHFVLGGEAEASADAFGGLGTAVIVALFGIFAILVLEFGSYRSTLIVLTVVPLGVFGGLIALLLTGNDVSFTASVGFVALIGIEIKNSILLVDFTNQLREQGIGLDEAIEQAGEIRFLPILLTSATAIGGLLPLALQNAGLYSPMSWVIIGGLVSSTLLARLVTPVVYKLIPPPVEAQQLQPE